MKKLIYGLGAIAATVTPVVAVVSCGKNDSKTESKLVINTQADLTKFLTEKGYSDIPAVHQAKILEALKGKDFTVVAGLVDKTKEAKALHGANDFAILIKGTAKKATDANMVDQQPHGFLDTNHILLAEAPTVANDPTTANNEAEASTLIARWGFKLDVMKNVEHVIFLQRDEKVEHSTPTAELMTVYASPAHFGLGEYVKL